MKRITTLIILVATLLPAVAQQVEFRYKGTALPDGATVTIMATADEWGSTSCATNPADNTSLLTLYNVDNNMLLQGTATIEITENTIGIPQVSWCMGGQCVTYNAAAGSTHTKSFSFSNNGTQTRDLHLDYDLLMLENYQQGTVRTKMTVTAGNTTRSLNIVFLYGGSKNSQQWWGYHKSSDSMGGLGTQAAETYDQAILVKADNPAVAGKTIKSVQFYLNSTTNMDGLKLWISKGQLPAKVDNADYVQDLKASEMSTGKTGNEITLTTPWTMGSEDIYVGYTYTIGKATTEEDQYPIVIGGSGVVGGLYLRTSTSVTSWTDGSSYGNLALHLLLEGDFIENSVTAKDFGEHAVLVNGQKEVPVTLTANGTEAVSSISYTITSDGVAGAEQTMTIPTPIAAMGGTTKVNIPFEGAGTPGSAAQILTITKVNGATNAAELPFATGSIKTVEELKEFPRIVLIEEFTTEYCGYCPQAASTLNSTFSYNPDLKEKTAVVCHHAGYYTDWLTIPASESYIWFYNEGGSSYAPAFMWDRYPFSATTPVESRPSNVTACKDRINNRLAVPANAGLEVTANFNSEKSKIEVVVNAERAINFCNTPARITLVLTEDNITARSQSGASGKFIHQHVARAVNSTWGEIVNWNGDQATYEYTFDVNSGWKAEDLKVVAFISGYDSTDPTNCVVENAAVAIPATADGIIAADADATLTEQARYTVDGQRIATPQNGINIVRLSDGRTVKVLVK